MTTRAAQSSVGVLYGSGPAPVRAAQSSIGALVSTVPTAAPTQVSQSAIGILARRFPVNLILEVFPSQSTFQTRQPKGRVDLL